MEIPLAGAQTKPSNTASTRQTAPAPLRSQSNSVLVPVFVYDEASLDKAPKDELSCARLTVASFYKLPLTEPFLPKDCDTAEIRNLRAKDFRIFEDGARQQVTTMLNAAWWTLDRDKSGWYMQSSLTPTGIWSSTNLGRLGLVPPPINRQLYVLSFVQKNPKPGCHHISVQVDRLHVLVFARDEYCAGATSNDPLFGTGRGNKLDGELDSGESGKIPVSVEAAAFRTAGNKSRVDISLHFPWKQLFHTWDLSKWALYARIGIVGVLRRNDGTVAARFSDLLYPPYWPAFVRGGHDLRQWELGTAALCQALASEVNGGPATHTSSGQGEGMPTDCDPFHADLEKPDLPKIKALLESSDPAWLPSDYETQVDVPPGRYDVQVVLSDEFNFGRAEAPLDIKAYDGTNLALSPIVLCKHLQDAAVAAKENAAANFAPQYVPLVSKGIEFTPAGDARFSKGEPLYAYFEVYAPAASEHADTTVIVDMRLVDAATNEVKAAFAALNAAPYEQSGGTTLRIARTIPISQLAAGAYILEVRASVSAGETTPWRTANFSIE
jgi:hypothetical protein